MADRQEKISELRCLKCKHSQQFSELPRTEDKKVHLHFNLVSKLRYMIQIQLLSSTFKLHSTTLFCHTLIATELSTPLFANNHRATMIITSILAETAQLKPHYFKG
uniref:Uncharacterized protein n=1 Tax=Spongospora subterranea TaxID=70186 RepID=A0A0H5RFJ8_9EUKA|eukprot:CRZ12960.1 hypothetical protein [Spongospora subterranea]